MTQAILGSILLIIRTCTLISSLNQHDTDWKGNSKNTLVKVFIITTAIDMGLLLTCMVIDLKLRADEVADSWGVWYFCRVLIDILFTFFLYLHANFNDLTKKTQTRDQDKEPPYEDKDLDLLLQGEEEIVYGANYQINN